MTRSATRLLTIAISACIALTPGCAGPGDAPAHADHDDHAGHDHAAHDHAAHEPAIARADDPAPPDDEAARLRAAADAEASSAPAPAAPIDAHGHRGECHDPSHQHGHDHARGEPASAGIQGGGW